MFKPRTYRKWVETGDLVSFEVREAETDLLILAEKKLEAQARGSILTNRSDIERYIKKSPDFYTTLEPLNVASHAPEIVKVMAEAGRLARVGPMAAVAGAMAEFVGRDLLAFTSQVIVENGGDIFIKTSRPRTLVVQVPASAASPAGTFATAKDLAAPIRDGPSMGCARCTKRKNVATRKWTSSGSGHA